MTGASPLRTGPHGDKSIGWPNHRTIDAAHPNVKEAVDCYCDETMATPKIIRLRYVREEVMTR